MLYMEAATELVKWSAFSSPEVQKIVHEMKAKGFTVQVVWSWMKFESLAQHIAQHVIKICTTEFNLR